MEFRSLLFAVVFATWVAGCSNLNSGNADASRQGYSRVSSVMTVNKAEEYFDYRALRSHFERGAATLPVVVVNSERTIAIDSCQEKRLARIGDREVSLTTEGCY